MKFFNDPFKQAAHDIAQAKKRTTVKQRAIAVAPPPKAKAKPKRITANDDLLGGPDDATAGGPLPRGIGRRS